MRYFLSFFISVYLSFILSPILVGFSWVYSYDYTLFSEKINISSWNSLVHHCFKEKRTTFILAFEENMSESELSVIWKNPSWETAHRHIDQEDGASPYGFTTFPYIIEEGVLCIDFSLETHTSINSVMLLTFDLRAKSSYPTMIDRVNAASSGPHIISRAEWGAPEEYRFLSDIQLQKKEQEWEKRWKTPEIIEETPIEKSRREQADREILSIRSSDPEASELQTVTYSEWGKRLIYPNRTVKKINKIVIHHTAEDMNKNLDDATLVRNIYAYHANVRWWSDIGYHYLIWQRGAIYEWRAWWDYMEGFHAQGNNLGSVAISVIGNYSDNVINRDQKNGIIEAWVYLAKKYGIDPGGMTSGARLCSSSESCIWKKVSVPTILWHRDLSLTACPWENLYKLLPEIRNSIVWKVWNIKPIYNPRIKSIETRPKEDEYIYVLKWTQPTSISTAPPIRSSPSKTRVKVALSYSGSNVDISWWTSKQPIVKNGVKRLSFLQKDSLHIQALRDDLLMIRIGMKSYTGRTLTIDSDLIRIDSWQRIPSWDTTKKYNDNLFRWKIIVRNIGGKILLVNELPIEDYLKWMWEVSESDARSDTDKVKSIIVAARSYALYYADPKLPYKDRKFPGKPYDISDNPDESQQYKGYSYELRSPTVAKLVDETRGEVVTFSGKIIKVPYSQSPWRGKTYSYLEYCQDRWIKTCKDIPYLQSIDDPGSLGTSRSGHGYGVSGIGATHFSRQWWDYKKILKYYLTGVEIQKK